MSLVFDVGVTLCDLSFISFVYIFHLYPPKALVLSLVMHCLLNFDCLKAFPCNFDFYDLIDFCVQCISDLCIHEI